MHDAIEKRTSHPGWYWLVFRNCTIFTEDVDHAGHIPWVPHREIFLPHAPEFLVKYTDYKIMIEVKRSLPLGQLQCMMGVRMSPDHCAMFHFDTVLEAEWTVRNGEHIVAQGLSTVETAKWQYQMTPWIDTSEPSLVKRTRNIF